MFLYGFASCTSLYEWLYIFCCVFVMYMFARTIIKIILVLVFVMYISLRMSIHILIGFVMSKFVRMTIYFFWIHFRHVNIFTNDYPFLSNGFSSFTCLYEWLSISLWMGFRHGHFCTNDYHFFFIWFSLCTCLNEWLCNSLWMGFRHVMFLRRSTISFLIWLSSWTFLYKRLSFLFDLIVDILHFCTNDLRFLRKGAFSIGVRSPFKIWFLKRYGRTNVFLRFENGNVLFFWVSCFW